MDDYRRMNSVESVYVDEAGFTGDDLVNLQQPTFVMSAVKLQEEEAYEMLEEARSLSKSQAREIKGKNLWKSTPGKLALKTLLGKLRGRFKITSCNKLYGLCCRFFDFVVEPSVKDFGFGVQGIRLHEFAAHALYIAAQRESGCLEWLKSFQSAIRRTEPSIFIDSVTSSDWARSGIPGLYRFFIEKNQTAIARELLTYGTFDLDLSGTVLLQLLSAWSSNNQPLSVICDESTALNQAALLHLFDSQVGRKETTTIKVGDREIIIGVCLQEQIQFMKSHCVPAIQIADLLASAFLGLTQVQDKSSLDPELLTLFEGGSLHSVEPDSSVLQLPLIHALGNLLMEGVIE